MSQPVHMNEVIWHEPKYGDFKINVDAAHNSVKSSTSLIVRDFQGTPILLAGYISKKNSPLNAELWAISKGFEVYLKLRIATVTIETDCLNAITLCLRLIMNLPGRNSLKLANAKDVWSYILMWQWSMWDEMQIKWPIWSLNIVGCLIKNLNRVTTMLLQRNLLLIW